RTRAGRELRRVRRDRLARGEERDNGMAGGEGARLCPYQLPATRLVHLAAAVLGTSHSHPLLRRVRDFARARGPTPRGTALRRELQAGRLGHLAPRPAFGMVFGGVPWMRWE